MAKYIIKRLFYAFLTILVLLALTFVMMHMLPGDPFSTGKAMDEGTKQSFKSLLWFGLNLY